MPGNPKPARVLKMRGTAEKHRLEARGPELELPPSIPEPPPWLLKEARAEWGRLLSISQYAAVISEADRPSLAIFCQLWARFVQSEKRGGKDMPVSKLLAMVTLGSKLGLDPSSRVKIRPAQGKQEPSRWEKLASN